MNNWRWAYFQVHGKKPPRRARRAWSPRKPKRDWRYRAWIRTLPCAVCGLQGKGRVEAAHTGSDGGTALKASDYSCIPLCKAHHQTGTHAYHAGRLTFAAVTGLDCGELVTRLNAAYQLVRRGNAA